MDDNEQQQSQSLLANNMDSWNARMMDFSDEETQSQGENQEAQSYSLLDHRFWKNN